MIAGSGPTVIQLGLADTEKLAAFNVNAKKVVIKNMNHIFKEVSHDRQANLQIYSQTELPIKAELVRVIAEFIESE